MNRKWYINLVALVVLGGSLVGCDTTASTQKPMEQTVTTETVSQGKQWLYSNLMSEGVQEEVKERLLQAGINDENVNIFLEWVNAYNTQVEEKDILKGEYGLSDSAEINYDDVYLRLDENQDEYYTRMDTNCRLTAALLMNDLIEVGIYNEEADNYLMFDMDAIDYDAKYEMIKENRQKFVTVFNPVTVQEGTDFASHIEQIQSEWQKRGITFNESAKASLVTLFLHDPYENKRFVGHVGVLVEDEEGFVLVEKYASVLPYQVTKFSSEQEVKTYLLSRGDIVGDELEEAPIVMRNNEVM